MKRIVLKVSVAALLISGTLVAGHEYDEPLGSFEQELSDEEITLVAQAEQEYVSDLQQQESRPSVQKKKSKAIEQDVEAFQKSRRGVDSFGSDRERARQEKALKKAEEKEHNAWAHEDRRMRKEEERKARRARRQERTAKIKHTIEKRHKDHLINVKEQRSNRRLLLGQWEHLQAEKRGHDRAAGKYADLYKIPAWPVAAAFFENRGIFNTTVSYNYATDAYDSSGVNRDLTILEFGEQPIRVKDVLLASKLVSEGSLTHKEFADAANQAPSQYLKYLADEQIQFLGKAEEYSVRFDLARYAFRNDLAIGVQLPLVYRKNRLRAHIDLSEKAFKDNANPFLIQGLVDAGAGAGDISPNAFMRRYGQDTDLFIKDLFKAKGIEELGGSAMGLGDVTLFMHAKINSSYFDKMVVGAKVQIPFAKESTTRKLWSPALGNDGHTEFAFFSSVLFSYRQFLNPHLFLQALFGAPAHVEKRVPKRIVNPAEITGGDKKVSDVEKGLFAFDDRVLIAANSAKGEVFNTFDTTLKNFGDNVTTLKLTTGFEMQMRIGNIIERFLSQRGFLDAYYYFRFKSSDSVHGINTEEWNPLVFTENTQQIEHTAGLDYSYQYDRNTRLVAGLLYTFAGMNVPKTFNAHVTFGFTFK
ncbi:hypothetical protein JST56_01655 [Candidatus Dependentiae bacterium]|nr:hypothetical protein [Candidatus Dependentiae bacterium]